MARYNRKYSNTYYSRSSVYRPKLRLVSSQNFVPSRARQLIAGGLFGYLALRGGLDDARRRRAFNPVLATEDRRLFAPGRAGAPAGALLRGARRLVVSPSMSTAPGFVPVGIGFASPPKVAVCVRRKMRREVLFAKGRGGGGHRPPRRNFFSDVRC